MIENNALFLQALEEVCDEEYDVYASSLENREPPVYSEKFKRKMAKLIKRRRKSYFDLICTAWRRTAACIAAFAVILTVAVVGVKANIKSGAYLYMTVEDGQYAVSVKGSAKDCPEGFEEEYGITVPEGFTKAEETRNGDLLRITYRKGKEYISFTQYIKPDFKKSYGVKDTEYMQIKDDDGVNYVLMKNPKFCICLWDNRKYIFEVSSSLNKDEVLKLCRSTKVKE